MLFYRWIPDFRYFFTINSAGPGFIDKVELRLGASEVGVINRSKDSLFFKKKSSTFYKKSFFPVLSNVFGSIEGNITKVGAEDFKIQIYQITNRNVFLLISIVVIFLNLREIFIFGSSWFGLLKSFFFLYILAWLLTFPNAIFYQDLKSFFLELRE